MIVAPWPAAGGCALPRTSFNVRSLYGGGPTIMQSTVLAVAIILIRERKSSWACVSVSVRFRARVGV